jgi:Family of unknown function (DUF6328)
MHPDEEHIEELQHAKEDWDRRFIEVLQELRVVQTGVQILFAYLLTLPFSNRFSEISREETVIYVLTLCATAAATAFLIAPVSYHRLTKPDVGKRLVVKVAARMAQAGLFMLLLAVTGAVYMVMDIVLHGGWAATITSLLGALFAGLWYVIPVIARLQHETKG